MYSYCLLKRNHHPRERKGADGLTPQEWGGGVMFKSYLGVEFARPCLAGSTHGCSCCCHRERSHSRLIVFRRLEVIHRVFFSFRLVLKEIGACNSWHLSIYYLYLWFGGVVRDCFSKSQPPPPVVFPPFPCPHPVLPVGFSLRHLVSRIWAREVN